MSQTGNIGSGTVRPAHAARQFAQALRDDGLLDRTWRVKCELHGALRAAGREHDVDVAVMLGLEGEDADRVDASALARRIRRIHDKRELHLLGTRRIAFDKRHHLVLLRGDNLPSPSNGMRLSAFDPAGKLLLERSYQERPCLMQSGKALTCPTTPNCQEAPVRAVGRSTIESYGPAVPSAGL